MNSFEIQLYLFCFSFRFFFSFLKKQCRILTCFQNSKLFKKLYSKKCYSLLSSFHRFIATLCREPIVLFCDFSSVSVCRYVFLISLIPYKKAVTICALLHSSLSQYLLEIPLYQFTEIFLILSCSCIIFFCG